MKNSALTILLFISNFLFSQENSNIKIGIKDNHFSSITSVLATKDEKNIISADETGKILMFSTSNYSYKKTIRESSGIATESMRLAKNDSILMISQKFKYSDGTADSLIMISLKDNKIILKEKRSFSFLGKLKNDVIISNTRTNYISDIEFFNQDFNKILRFETNKIVDIAEISTNKKMVIYTESDYSYSPPKKIITRTVATGNIVNEISIPEGIKIVHLYFDEKAENFYAISYVENKKEIAVYKGKDAVNWSNPIFELPYENLHLDTVITDTKIDNQHTIIFTSNSAFYQKPIMIKNNGDKFNSVTLFSNSEETNQTASNSLLLNFKNEILFFKPYNPNFLDVVGFYVLDVKKQKIVGHYPKTTSGFYVGNFLPNDNWMVMKRNDPFNENIKFYTAGTFKNRYDQMSIKNYIQVKHKIETVGKTFLDKQKGIQIFEGIDRDNVLDGKYYYYKYDLVNDKIYKLFDRNNNYFALLDFNTKNNTLLLSEKEYTNHFEIPSRFMIQFNNKKIEYSDTYKYGKLSQNGDYLLTINKDDILEIRLIPADKILFSKQLNKGNYSLFSIDASTFIINNNLFKKNEVANCYSQTIILEVKDEKVIENAMDCALVSDVCYKNENIGMIINNNIVVVNNKPVLFKGLEFPLEISFNSDASKFMISFKNGSIVIYETKTFFELGRMIHPDENSHVFTDNQNHYFSNIDAEQYLWATKNGQYVSLKNIENEVFKPERILTIFGNPNEEYIKVLEKAKTIREETKTKSSENLTTNTNLEPVDENEKPNLYLISIGVSKYLQSEYNLTFADKDALDISKIYGTLSENEFNSYNDNFFGHKFTLYDKKNEILNSIHKFLGSYKSVEKFFYVGKNNIWVEINSEKINIWDFNSKVIESIVLPKDFSLPSFSLDESFFTIPNGTGFAILGNDNNVFSYNIQDKKSKKYKLTTISNSKNYTLTNDEQWLLFDYTHVDSTSTISISLLDTNTNNITKKLKINPHQYQERNLNGDTKNIAVENYNSYIIPEMRTISSNGNHLMYSTDDTSLFLVDLRQQNPKPIKINLENNLNYSSKISIADDGKTFCILNEDNNNYNISLFDTFGKMKEQLIVENNDYSIKGITIKDADLKWIKMSDQLLEDSYVENENNKLLNDSSPYSFDKIYTLNLINENADAKSIKNSLSNFFKETKSNDQVMIFMAGHGVLDSKNNYYFAPHDMNFEKPEINGIAFEFIVNSLKNTTAKNKLLLLDSCHSGTTLDMDESNSKSNSNTSALNNQRGSGAIAVKQKQTFKVSEVISSLFDNFLSTSGVTILSASSGSDVAFEYKNSGNGAFTASYIQLLIEKISNGGFLSNEDFKHSIDLNKEFINEFFKKVMIATDNKQVPDVREINDNAQIKVW
jgi:hypothetical protein